MPPRESAAVSTGRSSAFASGTGENNLTVPGVLTSMAKAAPGAIKTMVKNEYAHDKTLGAGALYNRARAGAFNFGADVISGGERLVSGAVNAGATEVQHKLSDVGAGLTNWASSSMTGKSAGAQGSDHYRDVKPIPEISIPNITPEGEAFGGGIDRDPKVGTLSSLGTYVSGDPLESANRMVNAAGFLIPGGAGKVLGKGISKITGKAVTEGIEVGAAKAVEKTAVKDVDIIPSKSRVTSSGTRLSSVKDVTVNPKSAPAAQDYMSDSLARQLNPESIAGDYRTPFSVIEGGGKGTKKRANLRSVNDNPDAAPKLHVDANGKSVNPASSRNPGRGSASAAAGNAVGTNSSFAPASSPASAPAAAADPLDKTKPKADPLDKTKPKEKIKRPRRFDFPEITGEVGGKPTHVVRAK
jgi:hypothetical protein